MKLQTLIMLLMFSTSSFATSMNVKGSDLDITIKNELKAATIAVESIQLIATCNTYYKKWEMDDGPFPEYKTLSLEDRKLLEVENTTSSKIASGDKQTTTLKVKTNKVFVSPERRNNIGKDCSLFAQAIFKVIDDTNGKTLEVSSLYLTLLNSKKDVVDALDTARSKLKDLNITAVNAGATRAGSGEAICDLVLRDENGKLIKFANGSEELCSKI